MYFVHIDISDNFVENKLSHLAFISTCLTISMDLSFPILFMFFIVIIFSYSFCRNQRPFTGL